MLSIQLLGPPQLLLNDRALSISRRKSRALLFYLAAQPGPVLRDQLLALLWPDQDRASAQQVLRTSLYGLRKELGPAIEAADDTLALAPATVVDARRFERAIAAPNGAPEPLAAALALYRGDFLAGFSLPDCEEFESWAEGLRERYRQLAQRGYAALAQRHEAHHDYAAALDALERALALSPLQEDLQRAAMRAEYYAGNRAAAIRRYEQLRRLLDDELGVPPMDETRALYDAIITDALPMENERRNTKDEEIAQAQRPHPLSLVYRPSSDVLPFTGRDAELAQLGGLAASRRLGLIEGEPGIGKTRLASAFIERHGGVALIGGARELEQALPYQPVIEALRGLTRQPGAAQMIGELGLPGIWLRELTRLLPELHAEDDPGVFDTIVPGGNESRLWEALNQLLLALARRQPVTLLLDDLHWADASTLALLGYLVRQPTGAPLVFLATARAVSPRSPLAALVTALTREDRLLRVPLRRLAPDDTLALARQLSPTYAYPLAEWLNRNADGNPYILSELVRYAREHQVVLPNGAVNLSALSDAPVVPRSVYSLIESRLASLSDAARRVLDVAVAIGREFELDVVARAAGLAESAALDALDELRASRLVAPGEGLGYRFDHPLTMEVAYREVGEARHRAIHREVAEALALLHADAPADYAGLIASHFAEGKAAERAARYALIAGQRAADLSAWAEAIGFYQQALVGADAAGRMRISLALGTAYIFAGAPAQATEALRQAVDLAEALGDAASASEARLQLAQALISQARYADAITMAQAVLARGSPSQAVSAELVWGTALSIEGVDLAGAGQHLQNALGACAAQSDPSHLAHITFELGSLAAQQGDLPQAIEYYRRALAIAEEQPTIIPHRLLALNNLAYHLMLQGDPSAGEYAATGLSLAREYGLLGFQAYLHSTLGEIALAHGDLGAAERWFDDGLALAERLNIRERIAGITANLGLLAIRRGQQPLAIHRLSTALAQADALGTQHLAALIRIWLAPLLPPAEAHTALAEARAIAESGGRKRLLGEIDRISAEIDASA